MTTKPQYGWTTKATGAGNNLKLLRTSDISTGRVNWKTVPTCVNEPDDPSKFFLNAGDIVVARAGSVGKSFLIREDVTDAVFASYLVRFTPKILPEYVNFFMQSRRYWEQIEDKSSGIAIPNVNASKLSQVEIPVAPLNEQRRIVDKIESLFAQLDHGEAGLRDVQKLLARYRQSVLKVAVTGQLTANWRAENADRLESGSDLLARILEARRENWQGRGKYKEPAVPDTSDMPELPKGWVWASTEQVAFVETGATPKKGNSEYYDGGDIPWVTSTAVNESSIASPQAYITERALKETNAKLFPVGTLVVAMYGEGKTRGMVSELGIEAATNQACAALVVEHLSAALRRHLKWFYKFYYEAVRLLSSGGVQPNLNLSLVKATCFPLPGENEADEIVARLDKEMHRIELINQSCQAELTRSAALRQSILKDAFAGKLVPQDPSDEPASELLARIRAERDAAASKKRTRKKVTA
nr:restriction endonuclease subunit S [Halomonas alkalicola]